MTKQKALAPNIKKALTALLVCIALTIMLPFTVYADFGPKPSVRITFTGIEDQLYYGTLLSEKSTTGPATAWDGVSEYSHHTYGEEGRAVWQKFVEYEDSDGFFFLQEWWDCSENDQLYWGYYPPSPFKILLYFPESDSFYVSAIYERYAFDSYYTVDLSDCQKSEPSGGETVSSSVSQQEPAESKPPVLSAQKSYDYTWEIISLITRVILTILLELALAVFFGYQEKKLFSFLVFVNIITQILLNLLLNIINFNSGSMAFTFYYILIEIAVFVIEAVLYASMLQRYSQKPQSRGKAVFYALIANAASFAAGLGLSHLIPGIF